MPTERTKVQRIKLRIYKHPVKLDGTIIEFGPDGSYIVVEFDGPIARKRLFKYSEGLLSDKQPDSHGVLHEQAQLWEVL